ncbi:MAG: 4Fe-4S binding protein [Candidatus Omnitrophica bacterium]|nr:4Fe-4S binding protein [Candidatus Omnitrophota bacterium]
MAKRKIIKIDEEKCTGCGLCIPICPEGALQIIDGKARLISDLFCDGLGACLGPCPVAAITVEEREAEPYDENAHIHSECPGARMVDSRNKVEEEEGGASVKVKSQLRQWPVQLHLINPEAPYYQKADVLLAADCVAYALGNFHNEYLKGKPIAIACPKLDENQEIYLEKIRAWFEDAKINTLTVMIMQVPCCRGLLNLAQTALEKSKRKVPVKYIVVGIGGEIIEEEWL